jgi:hypothetical protein
LLAYCIIGNAKHVKPDASCGAIRMCLALYQVLCMLVQFTWTSSKNNKNLNYNLKVIKNKKNIFNFLQLLKKEKI